MITLIGCAIGFFIIMPVITFFHELGHAVPIVGSGSQAIITLGSGKSVVNFQAGSIELSSTLTPFNIGYVEATSEIPLKSQILSIAGGPVASLIMCTLTFFCLKYATNSLSAFLLRFAFGYCVFQFVFTSVPMTYGYVFIGYEGIPSDGKRLFDLLAGIPS